jgi:hypothetical protein
MRGVCRTISLNGGGYVYIDYKERKDIDYKKYLGSDWS